MLDAETKADIKQAFDTIKSKMPDFVVRFAQNKMLAQVANTFTDKDKNIACIEAPAGTGKTIAYLLAAIVLARHLNKKLIISTATIALQEQLINKDLPDVRKYSLLDFSFELIKGRNCYVCLRNLNHLSQDGNQATLFEQNNTIDSGINKQQRKQLKRLLGDYDRGWDGQIDSLDEPTEPILWQKVACNHHDCAGRECYYYDDCCFFKARKYVFNADVIVANHDLVLADLLGGNNALPNSNEVFYIFDEAHHLGQKALGHFAYQFNLSSVDSEQSQHLVLVEALSKLQSNLIVLDEFKKISKQFVDSKNALLTILGNYSFEDNIYLFKLGKIDDNYQHLCNQIYQLGKQLESIIDKLNNQFIEDKKVQSFDALLSDNYQTRLKFILSYYQVLNTTLNYILQTYADNKPPIARWIEQKVDGYKTQYILHAAKTNVAKDLVEYLWQHCAGAILTSATLTSLNSFDRLYQQLGLNTQISSHLRLASPFDVSKVPLIIAKLASLPNDEHYQDHIAEALIERLDKKDGSLVLFTATAQMHYITQLVEDKLAVNLMCQGQYNKQVILDKHKSLIDNKKGSVIFGLDSFYEGVDLPLGYLTHVLIVKLRFNVPSNPLEKTTHDFLQSVNQNAFYQVSLPDASLKLIQACGRLIRSEQDTGKITLFDRRIITKNYGKQLLAALPNYQLVVE